MDIQNNISNEDLIVNCIDKVTKGILQDMQISNAYASWKNTPKGLNFIKHDKNKFYQGVNMWLDITQNQIIGTNDNDILNNLSIQFSWINNILEIKKLII